jgi:hypothetical protein
MNVLLAIALVTLSAGDGGAPVTFHLGAKPVRIGEISQSDLDLADLYWSGRELCVAQGRNGATVRCHDPEKARWSPKQPRDKRAVDRTATRLTEGLNRRELTNPVEGASSTGELCSVGKQELAPLGLDVDGLSEPLVVEWNEYNTYLEDHSNDCTAPFCSKPQSHGRAISDVVAGCPMAVLFSPDRKRAVAVVPFSAIFLDQKIGRVDFYDETHYALWLFTVDG